MSHQFNLFGWQRPVAKVPISAAEILKAKELIKARDGKGAAAVLREIRYKLQAFESRISVQKSDSE